MNDTATLSSSPPRKFSSSSAASSMLWRSQYSEPHGNIWNSCTSLQPSSSIWGPQFKSAPQQIPQPRNHGHHPAGQPQLASPHMGMCKFGSVGAAPTHPRRMSSVTSLGCSLNTGPSSIWFEDPYLVSPPPSPDATSVSSATEGSLLYADVSPMHSPTFASGTLLACSQEEYVISQASGPLYLVQFKGDRIDVFTAPGTAVYRVGDAVMVDADRGRDLGTIVAANVTRREAAALKQRQSHDRQTALHANGCGHASNNSGSSSSPSNSGASAGHDAAGPGPSVYTPKQILGPASSSEISDMITKSNDEMAAVALCNKKAAERRLDMRIVDAEYQWDRRKLTFFYTADTRVDFRDLVRELFRMYKTRIWMCATTARS